MVQNGYYYTPDTHSDDDCNSSLNSALDSTFWLASERCMNCRANMLIFLPSVASGKFWNCNKTLNLNARIHHLNFEFPCRVEKISKYIYQLFARRQKKTLKNIIQEKDYSYYYLITIRIYRSVIQKPRIDQELLKPLQKLIKNDNILEKKTDSI